MNILLEDHRLEQVVKLVGSDALPPAQQYILFCAETIKNAFLQQNSFDPEDKFCSPEKQIRILTGLLALYRRGLELVQQGVSVKQIAALDAVSGLVRLKSEIPNRDLSGIDAHLQRLDKSLAALAAAASGG